MPVDSDVGSLLSLHFKFLKANIFNMRVRLILKMLSVIHKFISTGIDNAPVKIKKSR